MESTWYAHHVVVSKCFLQCTSATAMLPLRHNPVRTNDEPVLWEAKACVRSESKTSM